MAAPVVPILLGVGLVLAALVGGSSSASAAGPAVPPDKRPDIKPKPKPDDGCPVPDVTPGGYWSTSDGETFFNSSTGYTFVKSTCTMTPPGGDAPPPPPDGGCDKTDPVAVSTPGSGCYDKSSPYYWDRFDPSAGGGSSTSDSTRGTSSTSADGSCHIPDGLIGPQEDGTYYQASTGNVFDPVSCSWRTATSAGGGGTQGGSSTILTAGTALDMRASRAARPVTYAPPAMLRYRLLRGGV